MTTTTKPTATAADRIVDTLVANGVDTVFGIPGVQTYELYEALARREGEIRVIGTRHEQGAGYMAMGYGQSTGRPGVFSVVPGPGVLNAGAALLTGYSTNTPMVALTSEIPTDFMGRGMGHLHEMPDQLGYLKGISKWAENVLDPSRAGEVTTEAFRQALSGRPGPAVVATPWDVLGQAGGEPGSRVEPDPAPELDPAPLARAVELLSGAENPVIMVGGGARDAADEVRELAERLQAPVVSFRSGRGVVDDDHALGFTCAEGYEAWQQADVLLAIGTRQELVWFRWPDRPGGLKVVNLDIDPAQHERLQPDVALTADASQGARALLERLGTSRASRLEEYAALKQAKQREVADFLQPHQGFLAAIRAALPRDGFLVEEASQMGFSSFVAFPVYGPRQLVTAGYQGNLGFGFQTALGVKAAHPDRGVVSITGDGGLLFGVQELATAVQERLGTVTVVFDNQAYGNVKADQERLFGRSIGSSLKNPDFVAMARSFGAEATSVSDPDQLEKAVAAGIDREVPTVVHVPMPLDTVVSPWRFLIPASRTKATA